ncbi:MAG: PAS domain S-box protein [Anaerolineales bacterium]
MKDREPLSRKRTAPPPQKVPARPRPPRTGKDLPAEDLSPFFDSPLDLLCIGDRNAIFQKLNPQWEASLGYSTNEMEGRHLIEFIHPDDRSAALEAFREIERKKSVQTLTNRVRSKDGAYRWLEWKYILRGERIFATARDITDHKKAEDALRESRRMLETVLDTIPVRVFWKDRNSIFLGCNRPFARDAGFSSPAEIIGRDDYQMGWVEQADLYRSDDRAVLDTGREKIGYEEPQTQADGRRIWLRTSKVPLHDPDGNIRGVLGTYEDITDRKQAGEEIRALNAELEHRVAQRTEQLEAANKELEAFSFSVSHDLRAPLRAIDGFTRVLEEDYGKTLDEEGRRLCAVIRRNTRNMNGLIDDLLALSRLSRAEMEYMPTDMEAMVHSVFQEIIPPESRARIDFQTGGLPSVMCDPILLRQVWINLISNAEKYSHNRDRARIRVECRSTPEEDIFSIRDNGAGFDMQLADRLFSVFQRLHNASEFEGTGLGLAIVQRAIHRHGGRVWAEGEVDKGAVFYFSLPKK